MKITLIVTTYNWKEALGLSLASALGQTRLPDEIIVADDGSSDGTDLLVAEFAARSSVPVIHSWQEDKGFRAARSRNRAVARAGGEYIILIDGDIILDQNFIRDHLEYARQGSFVQGLRVLVNRDKTAEMLVAGRFKVSMFESGLGNRINCLRSSLLARLFSGENRGLAGIKTCNFAFWKADAVAVNGFNEDFIGWGREDSEFAVRLMNKGILRRDLRFKGQVFHLYHPHNSRACLPENDALLENAVRDKLVWRNNGLNLHAGAAADYVLGQGKGPAA